MTTPKPRYQLIYDGNCPFCTDQAQKLRRWSGERIGLESFQDPAVLAKYPQLTHAECMKEIKLVSPEGRVWGGAEALFRAAAQNPSFAPLLWFYLVPGIKQIMNAGYAIVARNRYKIKTKDCPTGTCGFGDKP